MNATFCSDEDWKNAVIAHRSASDRFNKVLASMTEKDSGTKEILSTS
jgi:hypothetical protein